MRIAVEAEEAGIDTVMLSEHVVMGPSAGAGGIMGNPRDYAAPGNQDPATPWPDSIVLASAIAAATSRIRIALAAVIAPLRHPLLLAHQLGDARPAQRGPADRAADRLAGTRTSTRALGVPFRERGAILDEQLEAMGRAWRDTPAAFQGEHFDFDDVYLEPKPHRPEGPRMWFGGHAAARARAAPARALRPRLPPVRHADARRARRLRAAMAAAGRDPPSSR